MDLQTALFKKKASRVLRFASIGAVLLTGCFSYATPPSGVVATPPPQLVVFLVVDGLPQRQITGYQDQFAPDGFNRFLQRGAAFDNAHYGHGYTVTAAGHAVMLTGAYPARTGVIGNEWRDPVTGKSVYCTEDAAHTYIGHKTAPMAGTSPRNLRAETVGDVLRRVSPASKVIAISAKDRGAILPAGHAGTAYMYMGEKGDFASSTYYMQTHPKWVEDFNATRPADAYFKRIWAPLLQESAYQRSVPDSQPWYRKDGNADRLPAVMGEGSEAPGQRFYNTLIASPFVDELTLNFARAALQGEALGQSATRTDILSISLSSHDYVNHAFGPESRISHDHMLHLDRYLQAFFADLDQRIGKDKYLAVLTADHGFSATPEWAKTQGQDTGRLNPSQVLGHVNAGLSAKFGDAKWTLGFSTAGILFDKAVIAAKGVSPAAIDNEARTLLLQLGGVAEVFTREQLASAEATDKPFLTAMRRAWHPDLSASIHVVLKPGWMLGSALMGTTHGSPHAYDTQVPILFYGPRWLGAGHVAARVEVADIASTLSQILRLPAPAQSEGRPLPLPRLSAETLSK
jgi:predicted AlkP superfamily pyrophosphatase or phosphodiesterase